MFKRTIFSLVTRKRRRFFADYSQAKHEIDSSQYKKERLEKLENLNYAHSFKVNTNIETFLDKYMFLDRGQSLEEDDGIQIAGRVHSIRNMGKNLVFFDLHQADFRVQIKAHKNFYQSENFLEEISKIGRGDIIGIFDGHPSKTKAGELSIVPKKIEILSPCMKLLPASNLTENSFKYRHRQLDLMLNPQTRAMFQARSKIIKSIRNFLEEKNFVEVETPILDIGAGGATADPFKTYHNDLHLPMWLRIAPELPLKQLVIGGLDRVYELGKQFRNEGIDRTHNPEFTSCEFYMAYADYYDLMDMTEKMLSQVAHDVGLGHLTGPTGLIGKKKVNYSSSSRFVREKRG